jgi:class 3 adenylate cyclase
MTEQPSRQRRKLSAILMADVSGFSRMMESHEERTIALIQDFHRRVKEIVDQHEGRVVDTAGDSVFGEFDSVVNAVGCARGIQEDQAAVNSAREPEERVETRIGVHLGDVVAQDYQLYGDGVNIAARLEAMADPGGICLSEAVYQQIHKRFDLPLEDLGLRELKNIEHPVRVYRVPPLHPVPLVPAAGRARSPSRSASPKSGALRWLEVVRRPRILVPGIVGLFLVLARFLLFRTGGIFPTAGSVLLGWVVGQIWAERTGRRERRLLALGLGIAAGAFWT